MTHLASYRALSVVVFVVLLGSTFVGFLPATASRVAAAAEAGPSAPDFTVPRPEQWGEDRAITQTLAPLGTPTPMPTPVQPTPTPGAVAEPGPGDQTRPAGDGGVSWARLLSEPPAERGYYGGLLATFYDSTMPEWDCPTALNDQVATEWWGDPIDFELWGQSPDYYGCRLHPALTDGISYAVVWQGLLLVPENGVYTFTFPGIVDDGGKLYLDVNQDQELELVLEAWCNLLTLTLTASRTLTAGPHLIEIRYHQGSPSAAALTLLWAGPGFAEEVIPVLPLPGDQCRCGSSNCELAGCGGLNCAGQPINTVDGNHTYRVADLSVPVAGRELSFARTYASQDMTATVLGYGWTHNWAMRLVFSDTPGGEEGHTIVVGPDGSRLRYTEHVSGTETSYTPYIGIHGELTRLGSTPNYTYVLTGTAQTVWTFSADGFLEEVRDAQEHATTLHYTTTVTCTNVLDRVTGPDADVGGDRYLEFGYDDACRLVKVRDHGGRSVTFAYDPAGDLAAVTDARSQEWTYTYTGTHLLYEVIDPNNHLVEKTDYSGSGQATRQWRGSSSDPSLELAYVNATTTVITDGREYSQTISYDARHLWTGTSDAATGVATRRYYDADFNSSHLVDANDNGTWIDWSDCGCRPTQVTDALSGTTTLTYDDRNNLTTYTDAGDHTTYYYYAPGTSLLVSTTTELGQTSYYTYSDGLSGVPDGLLIEMRAPGDQRTRYQYDGYGQMRSTAVYSAGEWITTTALAYDTWGRTISTTTFGRMDVTYYDAAGHVTRTVQNCTAGDYEDCRTAAYDAGHPDQNIVTKNYYDPAGNQVLVTNTLGVVTFYEYDDANRLLRTVENYDPTKAQNADNLYNTTTRYGYDAAGNQIRVTNTLDMVTWTGYDELNRVAAVTVNYTTTIPNPDPGTYNLRTIYGYDAAGNQVFVADPQGVSVRTISMYDALNRVVATTQNADPPISSPTTYADSDPGGAPWYYDWLDTSGGTTYQLSGSQKQVSIPLPPGQPFSYYGNQYTAVWATRYGYLYFGTSHTPVRYPYCYFPYENVPNNVIAPLWSYGLDSGTLNLRTKAVTDLFSGDDLFVVEYLNYYDATPSPPYRSSQFQIVFNLDRYSIRFQYRDLHLVQPTQLGVGIENVDGSRGVQYLAMGQPAGNSLHDQLAVLFTADSPTTYYGYDAAGNQVTVTNPLGVRTVTAYDGLNRVRKVTRNYVNGSYNAAAPDEDVYTLYHYDAAGRQDAVGQIGLYTTTYGFDALGRPTTATDPMAHTITSTYDIQGRLVATIDANGNTTTYGYNALGRTIAVTDALTQTAYYAFDGLGRRTFSTDAVGIVTRNEYDRLGRLITVTENYSPTGPVDAQTNVRTAYGYDALGNRLSVVNARGYTTTYEYDALSRLVTETDPLSHTWACVEYDALGRQVVTSDPLTVTWRVYDALGRLLQVGYGDTVSVTYAYDALGSRSAMTDITGLTEYRYDDLGRVLLVTHTVDATVAYTVGYGYDGRGLRTLLVYPDGTPVTSTYDLAGRLTAVAGVTTTYASYDYDPGNRLISATLGNGVQTAYAYDTGDQLLAISHTLDGDLLARFTYEYNAVGQRTRAVETVVAPDLWAEILAETPPTATMPAGPFHIYLPVVPREPGPAVADQPGHGGVGAPLPLDPAVRPGGGMPQGRSGEPIVRDKPAFRATFDEQGLRYEPRARLVEVGAYYVDWRLTQVRSGKTQLFHPGAPQNPPVSPPGQPDRVRYDRGDYLQEEYLVTAGGVEQRFVLPRPFPVAGDLEIAGNLLGNLEPVVQDTGEIAFQAPSGEVVASYGRAIVEEACGERLLAELTLTGRHLRIVVPQEWLATACFPVVVDPLIGPNFSVSTQPLGGNQERAALAAGANGRLLAAWHGAGTGTDARAQVLAAEGLLISATVPLDARAADQKYPDAAGDPAAGSYLAVWQHNAGGAWLPNWDIYARLVYSDGTYGASRIAIYTGTYNQEYPAVAFNGNDGEYLVVWRSYNTASAQYGIYGQVLAADGTLSGTAAAIYTSTAPLSYPDVSGNGGATQYLVVWQEYTERDEVLSWDIRGAIVAADGSAVVAAFDILTGTTDQTLPAAAYSISETAYLVVGQHYVNGTDLNDVRARWVAADGDLDPTTWGVATGSDDQRAPDAACGGNGECLVAWERQPNPGLMVWDVYGRRVDRGGLVGSAVTIAAATNDQRYPAVAYNALTAEYVVGWQDDRSGSRWDVYVQRVDADGELAGAAVLVSAGPADDAQDQPAAAYGTAEEMHLVVWTDDRNGNDDVYGQFVAGGGALVGAAFAITADRAAEQSPAVAYDAADDEYLVAWQRWDDKAANWDIYAQRVAGSGALLSSTLTLCSQEGDQTVPAVAYNAAPGYFLVTWQDARAGDAADVYARAVEGGTGTLADEFPVYTGEDDQYIPAAAANGIDGEYLVVWQEGAGGDISGQRTVADATKGDPFTITVVSGAQQAPAVAYDPEENAYLVVWAHSNGANDDVRGRMVAAEGELVGSEITITASAADEQYPAVAANGAGGYVVAWQSGATNSDIAAAVVDRAGQVLGSGVETLAAATNTQAAPALSYDAARGRYLAVWADWRNTAEGPDVYGQLYRDYTVVIEYTYDPLYRLARADYSSGVYFAYGYDEVGNRTILTETTPLSGTIVTTYSYDLADRLITVTQSAQVTTYTWSDRGDLLDDGKQEYTWDAAGRLTGVSVTDGPEVAYLYDGGNDRVALVVDGVTTTYVVDPYNPVESVSENSPLSQVLVETTEEETTMYLYGLDLLGHMRDGDAVYYGYDAQNLRLHLNGSGEIAAQYHYGPFGEVVGDNPIGYGYSGDRWDSQAKLLYLRARYYQPETGRFISRDPTGGDLARPVSLHKFLYVWNNPVNHRDPAGLWVPIDDPPVFPFLPPPLSPLPKKLTSAHSLIPVFRDVNAWTSEQVEEVFWSARSPALGRGAELVSTSYGFLRWGSWRDWIIERPVPQPLCEDAFPYRPGWVRGINPGIMLAMMGLETEYGRTGQGMKNPWNVGPRDEDGSWPNWGFTESLKRAMLTLDYWAGYDTNLQRYTGAADNPRLAFEMYEGDLTFEEYGNRIVRLYNEGIDRLAVLQAGGR